MRRVLVVEDNMDNLDLIRCALKRGGYEVLAAETGEKGVELAHQQQPYFIIMDIDLPGIDGFETTRRIRRLPECAATPIIAITSFAMRGDMEKVLASGCNGYFEKPINPLTIISEINKIVKDLSTGFLV